MKNRVKKDKSDAELLIAYCKWLREQPENYDWNRDLAKSIENVVSQVGTWQAKYEQMCRKFNSLVLKFDKEIENDCE